MPVIYAKGAVVCCGHLCEGSRDVPVIYTKEEPRRVGRLCEGGTAARRASMWRGMACRVPMQKGFGVPVAFMAQKIFERI